MGGLRTHREEFRHAVVWLQVVPAKRSSQSCATAPPASTPESSSSSSSSPAPSRHGVANYPVGLYRTNELARAAAAAAAAVEAESTMYVTWSGDTLCRILHSNFWLGNSIHP